MCTKKIENSIEKLGWRGIKDRVTKRLSQKDGSKA
jgi:hypothetical protein